MTLESGSRFGPYEVVEQIGSGGMGEVWRATDTVLNRDVAIKVLPRAFVDNTDRLARFKREAELLASLNHPNIATIHGLEKADDQTVIVMELVEGPTLADRIKDGPIPPDEAMGIAMQIVAALEAAHDKGIVHRDLKPANVKVKDDGTVKVLDFGISKPIDPTAISGSSPVMTTPAVTQTGVILGTAAYMSPEQARGKFVDQRTDIWAFGCLLFEMLTGQPAFGGEDVMLTLARVLANETNLESIPGTISPAVRHTIRLCLEKDPRRRIHHIGDVRLALEGNFESELPGAEKAVVAAPGWRPTARSAGMLIAGGALTALIGIVLWPDPDPPLIDRWAYSVPDSQPFRNTGRSILALSPDGRRFVYNTTDGLYVRSMDALEAVRIPGTEEGLTNPFFSADGQSVAYWAISGQLKRVALTGGAPIVIADVPGNLFGASWSNDGTILFGQPEGIFRVSADGGAPELVIEAQDGERIYGPELLPDGDSVLFSSTTTLSWDEAQIAVQSLATGERTGLISGGTDAHYVPTGHLVYTLGDGLFAVGFDAAALLVSGGSVSLVQGVSRAQATATGAAQYAIARDGTLVYSYGGTVDEANGVTAVWVDRDGDETPLGFDPCVCTDASLSPDGTGLALGVVPATEGIEGADVWLWSLANRTRTRLTFEPGLQTAPIWSPDASQIAYFSGGQGLVARPAIGTGTPRQLLETQTTIGPVAWLDNDELIYIENDGSSWNIGMLSLDGDPEPHLLLATEFDERRAALSPDGRWLAYQSDESGQSEIYVRPYPDVESGKWLVSVDGGADPAWSLDSESLFFLGPSGLMETAVGDGISFTHQAPKVLFDLERYAFLASTRRYAVAPDGQRFLFWSLSGSAEVDGAPRQIIIVKNWTRELSRRVPTG